MLAFLGATALMLVSAWSLTSRFRLEPGVDRGLGVASLLLAELVLVMLIAGALFHEMTPGFVLATTALLGLPCILIARGVAPPGPRQKGHPPLWSARVRRHPGPGLLVVLAVLALAWRSFVAWVLPPYAFDALAYHLPTVEGWLQHRGIVDTPLKVCCHHYPANGEMVFAWAALFLGHDTFIDAIQVVFAVLGGVCVFGIAKRVRLRRDAALSAGALFVLTPVVLAQASTNYVDVIFASTFLLAVYFLVRSLESLAPGLDQPAGQAGAGGRGAHPAVVLGLTGVATGFCAGTKPNGVIAALIIISVICVILVVSAGRHTLKIREAGWFLAALVTPLVVIGGYWYLRNVVRYGNPLAPIEVKVLGIRLFSGVSPNRVLSAPPPELRDRVLPLKIGYSWARDLMFWKNSSYSFEQRLGGLGPQWSYLEAPLTVVWLATSARRNRLLLIGVFLPIGLFFLLTPYAWWSRFTIPIAALGSLALAKGLSDARRQLRYPLWVATCALVGSGLWLSTVKIDPGVHAHAVSAPDIVRISKKPARDRSLGDLFFVDYAWLDEIPPKARVAVDLSHVHFVAAVIGPQFRRPVVVLAARRPNTLAQFLTTRRIEYVFVGRHSHFDQWLSQRPGEFELISAGRLLRAFAVRQSAGVQRERPNRT